MGNNILLISINIWLKFGRFLSSKYIKDYDNLHIKWYDNYFNIAKCIDDPHGLERTILANIFVKHGDKCIDFGCGDGFISNFISKKAGKLISLDMDKEALSLARTRYPHLQFIHDTVLNFEKYCTFKTDKIFCFSVIEFLGIEDAKTLLHKISDNLKEEGLLVLSLNYRSKIDDGFTKSFFRDKDDVMKLLGDFFQIDTVLTSEWNVTRTESYFICRKKQ